MIKKLMLVGIIATHCCAMDEKKDDVEVITSRLETQRLDVQSKNSIKPMADPKDPMITTYVNKENGEKITVYGAGL